MVYLKTDEEIELIRESGVILGKAHAEVAKLVEPGVKTSKLDQIISFERWSRLSFHDLKM